MLSTARGIKKLLQKLFGYLLSMITTQLMLLALKIHWYRHLNNMWIKYNMYVLHSLENFTWLHLMKTKNVGKFQCYEGTRWRDLKVPNQPLQFQGWLVYYFSLLFHIVKFWKILQVNSWTNILILRARILEMGRRREEKWHFHLRIETP